MFRVLRFRERSKGGGRSRHECRDGPPGAGATKFEKVREGERKERRERGREGERRRERGRREGASRGWRLFDDGLTPGMVAASPVPVFVQANPAVGK